MSDNTNQERTIGEKWRDVKATLYLNSIPGMADSIIKGGETPIEDCMPVEEMDW